MIYLIGSLANKKIVQITKTLRDEGFDVFSEWMASGEGADQRWWDYFQALGIGFDEAINSPFVNTAFNFDLNHLDSADTVVMVMPAGRSAGIELGYALGKGKLGYVLFDGEPERPDLMIKLATGIFYSLEELVKQLKANAYSDSDYSESYRQYTGEYP